MAIEPTERKECNDSAFNCFGTAHIFEERLISLKIAEKVLTFSSLAGPLAIGALVLAVGSKGSLIGWAVATAGALSILQIIVTLWAVIAGWQTKIVRYEDAMVENYMLSSEFKELANKNNITDSKWRSEREVLESRGELQKRSDLKDGITQEERRMGMCYALRFFERSCAACNIIPRSIESTNCPVCGQFKRRRIKWLM